jgi:hypothetical protein
LEGFGGHLEQVVDKFATRQRLSVSGAQPSDPKPSNPATDNIVQKIGPMERCAQNGGTRKCAPDRLKKSRIPQLHNLQAARDAENP